MSNIMTLDVRELAAPEVAAAKIGDRASCVPAQPAEGVRPAGAPRRSRARASETVTMVAVLVAWAVIAGYLFGHAAEGMLTEPGATAAVAAATAPGRA